MKSFELAGAVTKITKHVNKLVILECMMTPNT